MKRTMIACALAAVGLAFASPAAAKDAPEPAAWAGPFAPALYAVRDADSTLYLFGTIHLRRPGEPWADARVAAALAEAEEVWTEIEIDPAAEAAMAPLVQELGLAASGQPLSSHLTPVQQTKLASALQALGLPGDAMEPYRPWLAGLTVAVVQMMQAGFDSQAGVDRQVDAAAQAQGKTMRWFETPEEQLRFLSGLSEPLQLQMLLDVIEDVEAGPALLARMDAAWNVGDMAALEEEMVAPMQAEFPELYDTLLTQRNARWVETLLGELAGSGVDFVAVGAAHLIGEHSVIAMLEDQGLVVERVLP